MEEKIIEETTTEEVIAEEVIVEEPIADDTTEPVLKKKGFFSTKKGIAVIIAAAVILAVLIGIGLSFILPKSINGTWELVENPEVAQATSDEMPESDRVYYTFDKPNRYGKGQWHICYQGGVEHYSYEFVEEDSIEKINLGSENLEYKITGSKLLGNAKLTLIFPELFDEATGQTYEAQEYVLNQAKAPNYEKASYKKYEVDNKLTGEWATNERTLSYYFYTFTYTETVNINDKGIMTVHYVSEDLALDRYMYYAYTATGTELTFSLVTDKDTKYTVAYEFDEAGNLRFLNDTTSNSIFADAMFGDVTYYRPENLPAPTQATEDELYFSE